MSGFRECQTSPSCEPSPLTVRSWWPSRQVLAGAVKHYYSVASELAVEDGLLMRGNQAVIPASLRLEMLDRIHTGHQGITKCRERARISLWWPGLSKQLEELVKGCSECCKVQIQFHHFTCSWENSVSS